MSDFHFSDPSNLMKQLSRKEAQYFAWMDLTIDSATNHIFEQTQKLLAYENVTVIITQIYNPFNEHSVFFTPSGRVKIGPINLRGCDIRRINCHERTELAVETFNAALISNVILQIDQPNRLRIVTGIKDDFEEHLAPFPSCTTAALIDGSYPSIDNTYIQYFFDSSSNAIPIVRGDCIHPNQAGADAIAEKTITVINEYYVP